ncbi:ribonuclease H-like domain-containing protein [Tanacetum coccineum]
MVLSRHLAPDFSGLLLTLLLLDLLPSRCDSSLFIYRQGDDTTFLLLYVDDIVLTASSDRLLQQIIASLHREFSMTDLGALNYFLGISVTRDSSGMFLSQRKYAMEILERAHMVGCNSSRTPVDTESKLGDGGTPVVDPTLYRSLAGSLQYLTFTRPDITYAVQQVCLYMHDPREPHFSALKRILRYVQGTLDYGLQLFSSTTDSLIAYSDADWAGCPTTRRSTSGYCVFLGNNLLSWSSKRQPTLSRSSAEAEYRGVANAVAETCWIRNLLRELHTPLSSATIVYCDNVSAVYLSSNPVQHQRTKHIEIDIHFVRDLVATGQIVLELHMVWGNQIICGKFGSCPSRFKDVILMQEQKEEHKLETTMSDIAEVQPKDDIASIKRRRQDFHDVGDSATASGLGRLKEDQESSTWRWRQDYKAMPSWRQTLVVIAAL